MAAADWTFGINQSEYITVDGTKPSTTEEHVPRTIERWKVNEGMVQMMSEIGDGIFVAWGNCSQCKEWVGLCKCDSGPVEPDYIGRWRAERFSTSVQKRLTTDHASYDDTPTERRLRPARNVAPVSAQKKKVDSALDDALAAVSAATEEEE